MTTDDYQLTPTSFPRLSKYLQEIFKLYDTEVTDIG